jgi:hypothetical protein
LLIDRSNGPEVMPAPTVQLSTASFTHCGTGIKLIYAKAGYYAPAR